MLTLPDAKEQLNIDLDDTSQDGELQGYIDAVVSVVERQTGEVVTPRVVTETHTASRQTTLLLRSLPILDVESVQTLDGSRTWDTTRLYATETGMMVSGTEPFDGRLVVTVQAGYQTIPPNYRLAGLIILQHLWAVQRGSSGQRRGASYPEGGVGFAVPRRASELLGSMMGGVA